MNSWGKIQAQTLEKINGYAKRFNTVWQFCLSNPKNIVSFWICFMIHISKSNNNKRSKWTFVLKSYALLHLHILRNQQNFYVSSSSKFILRSVKFVSCSWKTGNFGSKFRKKKYLPNGFPASCSSAVWLASPETWLVESRKVYFKRIYWHTD